MLAAFFILTFGCGKSDQAGSEGPSDSHQMGQQSDKRSPDQGSSQKRDGQKPKADPHSGGKPEADLEEIDVDKLDIPNRMKEAIKSGQIPKERVREMLAQMGFPKAIPKDRKIDDMGLVYIRHGEPDQKITAVAQNVSMSDLSPSLASFYMNEDAEASENLNQLREQYYGFDMQGLNMSWKYYPTGSRPEMVLHFFKHGQESGWVIEAVPSALDNRETLGPKYYRLRQALISMQFAEIALDIVEEQDGVALNVVDVYNDMTVEIPKLVSDIPAPA